MKSDCLYFNPHYYPFIPNTFCIWRLPATQVLQLCVSPLFLVKIVIHMFWKLYVYFVICSQLSNTTFMSCVVGSSQPMGYCEVGGPKTYSSCFATLHISIWEDPVSWGQRLSCCLLSSNKFCPFHLNLTWTSSQDCVGIYGSVHTWLTSPCLGLSSVMIYTFNFY